MLLPPGTDPSDTPLEPGHPAYTARNRAKHSTYTSPTEPQPAWIFSLFFALLLLHNQPSASVLQVFAALPIIFLSVLSIPSTVPAHTSTSRPTPQVLAQASVTGSNRLGQLKPASPPHSCLCLSGLYWVNKLAQFPPILMRTWSHDSSSPTLKLSCLRDQFYYLFRTRVKWNLYRNLLGMYQLFSRDSLFFLPKMQFLSLMVPKSSFALSRSLF